MRIRPAVSIRSVFSASIFVAFLALSGVVAFSASRRHDIHQLSFMAGCWEMRSGDRLVEEQWMAPVGGVMMGMGRTTLAGQLVESEVTRIEQHGDSVIFIANPSGQTPSSFAAINVSTRGVVFQDLDHDFPQRVMYRAGGHSAGGAGPDSLLASVEGSVRGEVKTIAFPYARARCGATGGLYGDGKIGNLDASTGVGSTRDGTRQH